VEADSLRLVARYQAGDERAAEDLCRLWMPVLRRHFEVALGDRHAADDSTQQVLVRMLRALPSYRSYEGVPFGPWIQRIARNHFIDDQRHAGRVEALPPEAITQLREQQEAPSRPMTGWLSDDRLAAAYEELSEPQRRILALKFIFELSSSEIATLLGLSAANVRQLQSRALRALNRPRPIAADRGRPASSVRREPTLPVLQRRLRVLLAT
jgi:RNA polymerase sigma-70 factor (ECF subfamily)